MRTWIQGLSRSGNGRKAEHRIGPGRQISRAKFHTLRLEPLEQRVLLAVTPAIDLSITKTAAPTADTVLGTASSFAVLASSTVTNTGASVITGNLGVSPGTALTGFGPAVINGTIHAGDAVAAQAQGDLHTAYNILAGKAVTTNLTGQNLGGLTLTPGVYHFNTSAQLSGTLTLDAQGNPNAEFDFQIGSTLTTATGSAVRIINSGSDGNVFWQVGSSATLGTATAFEGSILAFSSITVNTGSSIVDGRALALSGAVTLADNAISVPPAGVEGANETYTITVKNNDAVNDATGVTMTDLLPANATFVSAIDGSGATITRSGNTLTDAIGNLAHTATDTITVVVTPTAAGSMTNTATVEGNQTDTNQTNNTAMVTTNVNGSVGPVIDLSITKTAAPTTGTVGVNETYTIVVKNNDTTNDATGVVMTDALPTNATFVSATDTTSGATLTPTGGVLSDAVGNLAHTATDTITVVVTPTAAGSMTNTATVEGNQADTNQANNSATVTTNVNGAVTPAIDLSITKTATPTTGMVGVNETYTIVVKNNDTTNDATGVSMIDVLPANATFVSAVDGSGGTITQSGNTLTDAIGSLLHTASDTITVVVTPTATGTITNMATVEGSQADTNQANNSASVTTTVNAAVTAIDLSITKTASPTTGTAGVNETYTIVVKNDDTSNNATGVSMTDVLPANATYVSATDGNGGTVTQSGNMLSDAIGNLAHTATDTITVVVTPTAAGLMTNTASVEGSQPDTNQSNNTATVNTNVNGSAGTPIDLSITKTAAPTTGAVGTNEVYTIIVKNNSTSNTATGVVMTDVLPANATFVSDTDGGGGTFTQAGDTLSDTIPSLAAGATDTITVTVTPTAAGVITNTASVEGTQPDTNQANNTASVTTNVNGSAGTPIDLSITKTAAPTTGAVGTHEVYTIIVKNSDATNTATGVVMTDVLPANATFVSDSDGNGGTFTQAGNTLSDTIPSLAAGATDTITVTVTPSAAGMITNTASVEGSQPDANQANNTATVNTVVVNPASANLSINKIASPEPDTVGQNLTYTITVSNSGGGAANNTTVTDTLPAGMTFVSDSSSQGSVGQSGSTLTANLGTLTAGGTASVTIIVTPTQSGDVSNTANVSTSSPNTGTSLSSTFVSTINPVPPPPRQAYFLAGLPGDGTDQTFVHNLYRELLGREPDAPGLASWLSYLAADEGDAGRRAAVISGFMDSPEYKQHQVTVMYEVFLHRAPEPQGLQGWVAALGEPGNPGPHTSGSGEGSDEKMIAADILGSPEYFALHGGTNQGYVDALYEDLLGRAADPGGEAYWMQQVANTGDRDGVARAIESSAEADHKLLNADYPAAGNAADLTLSPPGAPEGGPYALAELDGGGWENLYFQGNFNSQANDVFFQELQAGDAWDNAIQDMLNTRGYYDASQKP